MDQCSVDGLQNLTAQTDMSNFAVSYPERVGDADTTQTENLDLSERCWDNLQKGTTIRMKMRDTHQEKGRIPILLPHRICT